MLKSKQVTKFAIAGRFSGFTVESGDRIKWIKLQTYKGDIWIKVAKELRGTLKSVISIGDAVWVQGEKRFNHKNGQEKLKAHLVTVKPPEAAILPERENPIAFQASSSNLTSKSENKRSTTSILVCQKSDCQKRGSQSICRLLEETLRDRGLDEQITIKKVGCIKHCKSGPHIVVMPDKTRYSELKPSRIPELIEKHFPAAEGLQSA